MTIPSEFDSNSNYVHCINAFDTFAQLTTVHHPYTLSHDTYAINHEANLQFSRIAKQLTWELLDVCKEPEGLFDEVTGENIPDTIPEE